MAFFHVLFQAAERGGMYLKTRSEAGVVIRQIVSSMFERLNSFISSTGSFDWGDGQDSAHGQLPVQANDGYLLFQVRYEEEVMEIS